MEEDNGGGGEDESGRDDDDVVVLCVALSSAANYKYLSGLAILPSIAEAAAVAGDERYTFDERAPILPTKFLEDEDIHISSSPRAPRCVPTQAPHVEFVNTAPDSRYTSTYPRRIASS